METMLKFNRRSKDRIDMHLQCTYFIKGKSSRFETCTIRNLSRSGALLHVTDAAPERFLKGDTVHLDLLRPGSFDSVNLKAKIVRILEATQGCGLGIKMDPPLDDRTFHSLT